jgi:hypothetical protein
VPSSAYRSATTGQGEGWINELTSGGFFGGRTCSTESLVGIGHALVGLPVASWRLAFSPALQQISSNGIGIGNPRGDLLFQPT